MVSEDLSFDENIKFDKKSTNNRRIKCLMLKIVCKISLFTKDK